MNRAIIMASSLLLMFWGIAHLIPVKSVIKNFGNITKDNIRILTMEWISEGILIIFIATIVATLTALDFHSMISITIYIQCIIALNILSIVSFFTAYKVSGMPYKLCPFILTGSSLMIWLGIVL
jgi:hypothetical protein